MRATPNVGFVRPGDAIGVAGNVSVVLPCRNEGPYIEGVLEALRVQTCPAAEVVIIDGGSTDGTMGIVDRYAARHPGFPIRVVSAHGMNISAALNAGIAASRASVIVRMDAHSLPAPDYVQHAVDALQETSAAVVGGVWQILPGASGVVAAAIARAVALPMGAGDAAYRLASASGAQRRAVDTVPFGCFRRAHWEIVGRYNEQLLVNEDYEFNYRTRQAGGAVVLDSSIRCQYFARPTLPALARQYFRYGWWKGRMLRQHPRSIRLRQAVPALFLPMGLAAIAVGTFFPQVRPVVLALIATYAGLLGAAGLQATGGDWKGALPTAAAFAVIHTAWSAGISLFFLTGATATGRRQSGGRRPRAGLTGAQLTMALVGCLLLSVVVPAAIATRLHGARIARAGRQVRAIAASLDWTGLAGAAADAPALVFVGPGANPRLAANSGWSDVRQVGLPAASLDFALTPDPWGNHYVVYPPHRPSAAARGTLVGMWVLSAGPNGIIDTPFRQPAEGATIRGDDIGQRLE